MELYPPIPVLRIFDEQLALKHYVEFLGFTVDWTHRFGANFPIFMQISRGDCVIQLSEHHGDACPGASLRIRVDGLDELQRSLAQQDYKYAKPGVPIDKPWADRELELGDPFGNRLTFYEPIPSA